MTTQNKDVDGKSNLQLKPLFGVQNSTKLYIAIFAMCSIQMNFSYCALRGAVRALFFLSVLNVFSFSNFRFEVDAYCSINHRVQHGKVLKMAYSATELSNLKTITIKKLGSKLSEEYLLVTSTVKSSQSRSEVLDCIAQRDVTSGDINKKLKAKIVKEQERYDREYKNYQVMFLNYRSDARDKTTINFVIYYDLMHYYRNCRQFVDNKRL